MFSLRTHRRLTVHAPAKVNLTLEVFARRPDGFHELETLMLAVSVCDTLAIEATDDGEIDLRCEWATGLLADRGIGLEIWQKLPTAADNLVKKALDRLRFASGTSQGARVALTKRIPAQAGLGGASADAAAALLAANQIWELNWPVKKLAEVAAQLGSDVAFFLTSGAAICRGRGEQIEVIRAPRCHVVIVRPPVGLSTPAVFRRCHPTATRQAASRVQSALERGDWATAARSMHNGLQSPAEELSPWIGRLRSAFEKTGCIAQQMSGSGSSYFGLFWHAGQARRVARRLRGLNLGAVMVGQTICSRPQACTIGNKVIQ